MVCYLPRICLVVLGALLIPSTPATSGVSRERAKSFKRDYFKPPYDLQALNAEYATALMCERRLASTQAPDIRFDANMLTGTVLRNQHMVEKDSLFHDYLSFHAELVGYLIDIEEFRNNPRQLARYIWTRFAQSPKHAAIQRDASLCYVSVSCSNHYFVVRMDDHPTPLDKAKLKIFRQWQAHSSAVAD